MLEIRGEALEVGSVIANAFRLERVVGQGGMGIVWAARDIRNGRVIALKFLRENRADDVRNQERFLREARAAMAVMHPAVARVEAVLETNAGVPFLVMELLEGEPLRAVLQRRLSLTPFEISRLLLPVVDAVGAAHSIGIVHRDLKPENVFLLAGSGAVRVLDFGIAKQLPRAGEPGAASLTSTGAILGTPIYMAPEQVFGDADLDAAADVWSLGIMLYEALAGHAPTEGDGFGPIIRKITTDPILPLDRLRPDVPRRMTGLVDRMLTRDRTRRAPLAEVRAVLSSITDGGENGPRSIRTAPLMAPLSPPPYTTTGGAASYRNVSTSPAPAPAPRSNAWIFALIGVLVVLLGAGGAGVWYVTQRQPPTPSGGVTPETSNAMAALSKEIATAIQTKDAAKCKAKLDDYDARFGVFVGVSTDPANGLAAMRGQCLMLNGKCDEGRKLVRADYSKTFKADQLESLVKNAAIANCPISSLSPVDAAQKASYAMLGMDGVKVNPADCPKLAAEAMSRRAKLTPAQQATLMNLGSDLQTNIDMCVRQVDAVAKFGPK